MKKWQVLEKISHENYFVLWLKRLFSDPISNENYLNHKVAFESVFSGVICGAHFYLLCKTSIFGMIGLQVMNSPDL